MESHGQLVGISIGALNDDLVHAIAVSGLRHFHRLVSLTVACVTERTTNNHTRNVNAF